MEVCCDDEAGDDDAKRECWCPARVARFEIPNIYVVCLLGDDDEDTNGGGHRVDAAELRPVQDHGVGLRGGAAWATAETAVEGLRVEAFYAQGGSWISAHVDGCDCDDTVIVTFDDFDHGYLTTLRNDPSI